MLSRYTEACLNKLSLLGETIYCTSKLKLAILQFSINNYLCFKKHNTSVMALGQHKTLTQSRLHLQLAILQTLSIHYCSWDSENIVSNDVSKRVTANKICLSQFLQKSELALLLFAFSLQEVKELVTHLRQILIAYHTKKQKNKEPTQM